MKHNKVTVKNTELLTKLIAKQNELKLSDYAWADLIHVSRPTWTLTRNRKNPIQILVLTGVAKAFPPQFNDNGELMEPGEFDLLIIAYLRNGSHLPDHLND